MRIESAFYTSKEGLEVNGKAISVIGDNISNANTTAYKENRAEFSDIMAAGFDSTESENIPSSGNGVRLQTVRTLHVPGTVEFTGRQLDFAIGGNGYFQVGDPNAPFFTRAGNFLLDSQGFLTTPSGQQVLGLAAAEDGTLAQEVSALNLQDIDTTGTPTTSVTVDGNFDSQSEITALPQNPQNFRDVGALASFQMSLEVFDSLGARHTSEVFLFKTDVNTWTAQAYVNGGDVGQADDQPVLVGSSQLTFDTEGQLAADNAVLNATTTFTGAAQSNIGIDLSGITQFASGSQVTGITSDGQGAGNLTGYEIDPSGNIFASLDSGNRVLVGALQLANFTNVDGLERIGENLFTRGDSTGDLIAGAPGTGSFGSIEASSLETSNIDISKEFVSLILYQRAYQANSQILDVANGIIQDTLGLIR